MKQQSHLGEKPTIADLVAGVLSDVRDLFLHELRIAQFEVEDEIRKARGAAIKLGIGAAVLGSGILLALLMVVHIIDASTEIPLWVSYGIVGVIAAVTGRLILWKSGA